ncbi:hypothetical protein ASALC70_02648 [Alcanivorax sp. ALC70]|nr:hypothetical protein ASALC70_02648 [Alcanivorax sp. ALC70]
MHAEGIGALPVFHAHRFLALQQHPGGERVGLHVQVGAGHGRLQVGQGGGAAHAVAHRHVHAPEAFLAVTIVVLGVTVTGLLPGLDEGPVERVLHVVAVAGGEAALVAPVDIAAVYAVLRPFEIGQHLLIAPALSAQRRPFLEIAGAAAHVGETVDRRRAPQHLAPGLVDAASLEARFPLGMEPPVVALHVHGNGEGGGHLDEDGVVAATELQHLHGVLAAFAEPVGHGGAGGAGAHDHVIEYLVEILFTHVGSPLSSSPRTSPVPPVVSRRRCRYCRWLSKWSTTSSISCSRV